MIVYSFAVIDHFTTVIVKIKGKPRSLFCYTRTINGKMMDMIIYMENKYVELIGFCP
jgi:hypothetical protein